MLVATLGSSWLTLPRIRARHSVLRVLMPKRSRNLLYARSWLTLPKVRSRHSVLSILIPNKSRHLLHARSWLTLPCVWARHSVLSVLMPKSSRHLLHALSWHIPIHMIFSLLRRSKLPLGLKLSTRSVMHGLALPIISCRILILLIVCTVPKSWNWSIPGRTLASKLSPQLLLHIRASSSMLIVGLVLSNVVNTGLTRVMVSEPSLRLLAGHFQRLLLKFVKWIR